MDKAQIISEVKKQLELLLEKGLEQYHDQVMTKALEEIKKAIPGIIDDMAIEAIKPKLMEVSKAEFAKLIEKISEEV